jgi:thioredoxin family protein
MFPHERSLVEKMKGKPFNLIGVNSDKDPAVIKRELENNQVNWRSYKNKRSAGESVSQSWQVKAWPSLFLIDHKGVIREKWVGDPGDNLLHQKIEELLREAEAAKNAKKG